MRVIGLDPGPVQSALVYLHGMRVISHALADNAVIREALSELSTYDAPPLVIEKVESFGMAVGAEVFETVFESGRFAQGYEGPVHRLGRREIKVHLCGSVKAKDANIRQALMDRWGGKDAAIGRKGHEGPLYGLKSHLFAALAVAVTWQDLYGPLVAEKESA